MSQRWQAIKTGVSLISKAFTTGNLVHPSPELTRYILGAMGKIKVTEATADKHTAIYRCEQIISGLIASLPVGYFERQPDGTKRKLSDHDQLLLLRDRPNPTMSAATFWTSFVRDILRGNGYALIERDPTTGRPSAYYYIAHSKVHPFVYNNKLWYDIDGMDTPVAAINMLHVPHGGGIIGRSVIELHTDTIALGLANQQIGLKFYENGSHLGGVVETDKILGATGIENLREGIHDKYSGADKAGQIMVLEDGAKFKPMTPNFKEAQYMETKLGNIHDVCRMYGVPPWMVAEAGNATMNNAATMNINFVQFTILPLVRAIEQEVKHKSVAHNRQEVEYFKMDLKGVMRGDMEQRAQFFKELFYIAAINPNEIRQLEEMDPYDGGDTYYMQANLIPVDMVRETLTDENKAVQRALEKMRDKAKSNGKTSQHHHN